MRLIGYHEHSPHTDAPPERCEAGYPILTSLANIHAADTVAACFLLVATERGTTVESLIDEHTDLTTLAEVLDGLAADVRRLRNQRN